MKKLYIQPSIEIEMVETLDMIAGSPQLDVDDFSGNDKKEDSELTTNPTGGDLTDMAKGNNHWDLSLDSDW